MSILNDAQLDAVSKLKNGYILCGGVGTGKSRTALAYYYTVNGGVVRSDGIRKMKRNPQDLYIITTARKRDTKDWEAEMPQFGMLPGSSIYKHKIVIDSWNKIESYVNVSDAFFIFDEQRVTGSGPWVKSFQKIVKKNNWILLTATPGDNWLDYVQVFIANGFYRNKTEFIRNHVVYKPRLKFPKVDYYVNTGRLIRLRNKILVDIPVERDTIRHHEHIEVGYNKVLYKKVISKRQYPDSGLPIDNASALCYELRKIVNSDASRQVALLELLEDHQRAIIFYNFDYELEILRNLGYKEGVEIAEWNGHKHQPVPSGPRWVYLVQYTAGAEGWNCITADTVIFYSRNYSYKVLEQACGRIDRMNTLYIDLYYYHLYSKSSIDVMIGRALKEKKTFNEGRFVNRTQKYLERRL